MHSVASSSSIGVVLGGAAVVGLMSGLSLYLTGLLAGVSSSITSSSKGLTGILGVAKTLFSYCLCSLDRLMAAILVLRSLKDPAK